MSQPSSDFIRLKNHPEMSPRKRVVSLDGEALQFCSMLSVAELDRRPSRPPDYEAENRALLAFAQSMAEPPDGILQKFADTALVLCRAHSAGFSLLEDADQKRNFHWRAIVGQWAPHLGGGTPRDFGPCGTVLDNNTAMLCCRPERDFPYLGEVSPLLDEGLLIPFYVDGEAVGTIWIISHDESRRFDAEDLRVMTNLAIFASSAYQTLLSRDAARRSEAQIAMLAREAEHRAKNVLATVQATVHLSSSDTPDGLKHAIEGRIQALAGVHRLFVESRWVGADLQKLVTQELVPYRQDGKARVRIEGPHLLLETNTAQTVAVILHELVTNSVKYGALSITKGRVEVEWSPSPDGRVVFRWIETDAPPVKPPARQGFGMNVMQGMVRSLRGDMHFDWREEGLSAEISIPM